MIVIPFKQVSGDSNNPLLSVVTVVYNGANTIENTIQSVINQTYKNVEYIIIDGASKDSTLDIIRKYQNNITYCISEPDNGIYDAMNKGICCAHGEYISLLNSDDWLEPNALEIIKDEILKEKYDVYHAITRLLNVNDKLLEVYGPTVDALYKNSLAHQTCFVSKKIYSNYLYDTKYKSAADYDFFCKLVKDGKSFKYIEKILANYRLGGMSDSCLGQWETYKIRYKYGYISFFKFMLHELYFGIGKVFKR